MSRNETKEMRKAKKVCLADLAQVGPGTPVGEWFRRYWTVAGTTRDLYDIPQAVRLLGEDLVLFRDANGKIGLVGQNCPHRGTSLEYGEIEDGGIRCPYHGWLFNIHGQCLEMPGEPKDSKFAAKVKHLAYPVKELGGLIFAYMGPDQDNPPPLPKYKALAEQNSVAYFELNLEAPLDLLKERLARRMAKSLVSGKNHTLRDPEDLERRHKAYLAYRKDSIQTFDSSVLSLEDIAEKIEQMVGLPHAAGVDQRPVELG